MSLGEKIKEQRKRCGLSQEKVAEFVEVSRQAVTKWESGQSAPSTENLFKLAEIFGTTVDFLLTSDEQKKDSPAEQIYYLYKMEKEKKACDLQAKRRKNALNALYIIGAYIIIYLIGRIIWCDISQNSIIGWLFFTRPKGEHSYLYGWLLSSNLFWIAAAISTIPAIFGKFKFSITTLMGFVLGLLMGMTFGPNPDGLETGQTHYGWAIWGTIYLLSVIAGILTERFTENRKPKNEKEIRQNL